MSSKEVGETQSGAEAPCSRYGEELLSANWNPVVDLLHVPGGSNSGEGARNRPQLREEDVEGFLYRIYLAGG